jgi:hypothetical protein
LTITIACHCPICALGPAAKIRNGDVSGQWVNPTRRDILIRKAGDSGKQVCQ